MYRKPLRLRKFAFRTRKHVRVKFRMNKVMPVLLVSGMRVCEKI